MHLLLLALACTSADPPMADASENGASGLILPLDSLPELSLEPDAVTWSRGEGEFVMEFTLQLHNPHSQPLTVVDLLRVRDERDASSYWTELKEGNRALLEGGALEPGATESFRIYAYRRQPQSFRAPRTVRVDYGYQDGDTAEARARLTELATTGLELEIGQVSRTRRVQRTAAEGLAPASVWAIEVPIYTHNPGDAPVELLPRFEARGPGGRKPVPGAEAGYHGSTRIPARGLVTGSLTVLLPDSRSPPTEVTVTYAPPNGPRGLPEIRLVPPAQ